MSLFSGIVLGVLILNDFSFLLSISAIFSLFETLLSEAWILKTLAFVILVGSIMALIEKSGGIQGFIEYVYHKKGFVTSGRSALLVSYVIGIIIFIESSITSLVAGAVGKPLCDTYKVPHAKLAFVCDSTSAPVCSLIVLNGWGALLLGLISTQIETNVLEGSGIALLLESLLYNFYAMSILVVTFITIWFGIDIGPMKYAQVFPFDPHQRIQKSASMKYALFPIVLMVLLVFVFLYSTGSGNILQGSGSSSVFYTMVSVLLFTLVYFVGTKNMSFATWGKTSIHGAKKFLTIALILLLAFAIGEVTSELKTGMYLASLASENLSVTFLAAVLFLLASLISFATGTSWGTFSIMIPIAVPMAVGMEANVALCIGAVISGGVFGDHCSPISDTTIISAMASDCDIVEHVQTQLPYALIGAFIAFILFIFFS